MGLMHVYAESDEPRACLVRESSKHNYNLVKAELGRPRRVTHKIYDPKFIYGRPNERGALGVKEVLVHVETVPVPPGERYGPDFKAMNKLAAINHYCRANEQRAARERFYVHIRPNHSLVTRTKLPSDKDPHHIYGLESPPHLPFEKLIAGGFQDEWIKMNECFKSKHPERYTEAPTRMEVVSNRANDLFCRVTRDHLNRPPPKKRFILPEFQNVPKRIDNENKTPLKRGPPYHKFFGCGMLRRCMSR